MSNRGLRDVASVQALSQQVVDLMTRIDEEDLIDALNGDNEVATGAMYARALVMDLIELKDGGVPYVQAAHATLSNMADPSDGEEDA